MRGLTLLEVVIGSAIMLVLTGLLIMIFHTSGSAFRRGSTRMHAQQQAREVVRRATPLVMSAVPPSPLEEAIYLPVVGDIDTSLEFYSADDLLNPPASLNPRLVSYHLYRLSHASATKEVWLQELAAPARTPLGAGQLLARHVEECDFERLDVNMVRLRVMTREPVRTAVGKQEDLDVERSSVIALPYYAGPR
ncbi:MAG: hypothetical protein KC910_19795 [Candidatus Eremiobacteraeota bacterium]|nr:hypothetical protein [Candidatus Eremiobacteraeota bacterium]